jgi:hypothetical protein
VITPDLTDKAANLDASSSTEQAEMPDDPK